MKKFIKFALDTKVMALIDFEFKYLYKFVNIFIKI